MSYFQILAEAIAALVSQTLTIRVGNFTLTATNNGAPVKFTFGMAIAALEAFVASGEKTGSFQVGSTLVTVTKLA
jgi:hypothetical protein